MTDTVTPTQADMIDRMTSRFLAWKLPEDFNPDAGISFKAEYNEHTGHPMRHEPTGTNLFSYAQAREMVRAMVASMVASEATQAAEIARLRECDVLLWLSGHADIELSFDGWDEGVWNVHQVNGGRSDREWKLIAQGETPLEALTNARAALSAQPDDQGGDADLPEEIGNCENCTAIIRDGDKFVSYEGGEVLICDICPSSEQEGEE